ATSRGWVHALLVIACLVVVFTMLWMISTALKSPNEIFAGTFRLWPAHATLQNFRAAMTQGPMRRVFDNSLVVALAAPAAQAFSSPLAASASAILKPPGRHVCFALFVATMM